MGHLVSTKTFGHDFGLSCCFRQWRASSHCRFLHGYALAIHLEFQCRETTPEGWVVDFGRFAAFKETLRSIFDHKTLVADDDPLCDALANLANVGAADIVVLPAVGCEAFALLVRDECWKWIASEGMNARGVELVRVRIAEHDGNGAEWRA